MNNYKSRDNWNIPLCLKQCRNKGKNCEECFLIAGKFSKYEKDNDENKKVIE